jgi:hypothetical protein
MGVHAVVAWTMWHVPRGSAAVYPYAFATRGTGKIRGFHGGDYEEWCLLGCYALWLL